VLSGAGAAEAAERRDIDSRGEDADDAYRAAVERPRHMRAPGKETPPADTERELRRPDMLRRRADAEMGTPRAARSEDILEDVVPTITAVIESTRRLRHAVEYGIETAESRMAHLQQMKDALWVMSEYAGRERAAIGAAIARGVPLPDTQIQALLRFRGRVEGAWDTVEAVAAKPSTPSEINAALAEVRTIFLGRFEETRKAVYAAGTRGTPYPIGAADWIAESTDAIDTILRLSEVAGRVVERTAAEISDRSLRAQLIAVTVLALGVAIAAGAFFVVAGRVAGPLVAMTAAMVELAGGNRGIEIPGVGRGDEV